MHGQKTYEIILDKEKYSCMGDFIHRCEKTGQTLIFSGATSSQNLIAIVPENAFVYENGKIQKMDMYH